MINNNLQAERARKSLEGLFEGPMFSALIKYSWSLVTTIQATGLQEDASQGVVSGRIPLSSATDQKGIHALTHHTYRTVSCCPVNGQCS